MDPTYLCPDPTAVSDSYAPFGQYVIAFGFSFLLIFLEFVFLQLLLVAKKYIPQPNPKSRNVTAVVISILAALFQPAILFLLFFIDTF
jgi:hypothetical protein